MGALIEDTRNKKGQHELKRAHFEQAGEVVIRNALPVGDYQRPAKVSVDTKKDIYELAMDLTQDHDRFRRECEKAKSLGTQLVILTENEDGVTCLADLAEWRESDEHFRMRNRNNNAFRHLGGPMAKKCQTMHKRYGVIFGFCTPSEAGAKVIEILDYYEGGE